jgi:hypothetical protein
LKIRFILFASFCHHFRIQRTCTQPDDPLSIGWSDGNL